MNEQREKPKCKTCGIELNEDEMEDHMLAHEFAQDANQEFVPNDNN